MWQEELGLPTPIRVCKDPDAQALSWRETLTPQSLPRESAQDPRREKLSPPLCSLEDLHWPRQGAAAAHPPLPLQGGLERHLAGPSGSLLMRLWGKPREQSCSEDSKVDKRRQTHPKREAKSGGAGGHAQLPTWNVLWGLRLPSTDPCCSQVSGQISHVEKPHCGRVDSISHLARTWEEGLESWGAGELGSWGWACIRPLIC